MDLKAKLTGLLKKILTPYIKTVTCFECCKYYKVPEMAACGHTLCHSCWLGRRRCPYCAAPLDKRLFQFHLPLQTFSKDMQSLDDLFDKYFDIKFKEFDYDVTVSEVEFLNDSTNNMNDSMTSSQSHFSAALLNSESNTQETNNPVESLSTKIQIHTDSKKIKRPEKVVYVHQPQDDWDKIEKIHREESTNKENIRAKNNPRRIARNKDHNQGEPTSRGQDISLEKYSSKNSSGVTDLKSNKAKQNQELINQEKHIVSEFPQAEYVIEENTPVVVQEKPKDSEQNLQPEMVENNSAERALQISDKTDSKNANQHLFSHNLMNTDQDKNIPLTVSEAKSLLNDVKKKNKNFNNNSSKIAFIEKGTQKSQNMQTINIDGNTTSDKTNNKDIEFIIKIGNTVANIAFKKITNDVQLKGYTDRAVQTSLVSKRSNTELDTTDSHNLPKNFRNDKEDGSNKPQSNNIIKINKTNTIAANLLQKSLSTKKNTASAETATAHFEITGSVEKKLSNTMECEEIVENHQVCLQKKLTWPSNQSQSIMKNAAKSTTETNRKSILNESHITDDMDIFENDLKMLKNSNNVPSETLPTAKSTKVANHPGKRNREDKEEDQKMAVSKKIKLCTGSIFQESNRNTCSTFQKSRKNNVADNDSMNYDVVMDQVFASINVDMQKSPKGNKGVANKLTTQSKHFHENSGNKKKLETSLISTQIIPENAPVVMKPLNEKYSEKNTDSYDIITKEVKDNGSTQQRHIDIIPPKMCQDLVSTEQNLVHDEDIGREETPQKTVSFTKPKSLTLETPLTMRKFVDQIRCTSTPVAKKVLTFTEDDTDSEQKQEKEIEQTRKLSDNLKYCIAGSCLPAAKLANVKLLCRNRNWNYVHKYTKELTHLVVGVDEENKSQRSLKYMCALAASKWILSYEWVEACLKKNTVMAEISFEVLDGSGEPGPRRSRMANNKLFQGITFYCLPPFSGFDVNTFKEMLEDSGGRVVNDIKAVKATAEAPALLLAELQGQTEEDRSEILALPRKHIVPVTYEWVLDCLGTYALSSIYNRLLCPSDRLPSFTSKWPAVLISRGIE